jgi:hypothetical protein
MAFNPDYFGPIGPQSNVRPNMWSYKTADATTVVDAAGYFPVGYGIKIGDIVYRTTVTNLGLSNEALASAGLHIVKDVSKTQIDVTDTTVLDITDTR